MLLILIPFFLLTSALAGGLAYFAARFIFTGARPSQLRVARTVLFVSALIFPVIYFGLYMRAKPQEPGDPPVTADVALIPAVWVGLLLLGGAIGLARAIARR